MTDDELDLSQFEEFSSTARGAGGGGGGGAGPSPKRGAARAGTRRRHWPWLVVGIAIGVAATLLLPPLVAPYVPPFLQRDREEVRGAVVGKRLSEGRLLLTLDAERGALLATFGQRVAEIDLLVEVGDTLTLGIDRYAPFVEDPVVAAVQKPRRDGAGEAASGSGEVPPEPSGSSDGAEAPESPEASDGPEPSGMTEDADGSDSLAGDSAGAVGSPPR